jgi:hypothetical protein
MPKYICRHHIKKDGRRYEPGEEIELTMEEAQAMPDAVELLMHSEAVPEPEPPPQGMKKKKGKV